MGRTAVYVKKVSRIANVHDCDSSCDAGEGEGEARGKNHHSNEK